MIDERAVYSNEGKQADLNGRKAQEGELSIPFRLELALSA